MRYSPMNYKALVLKVKELMNEAGESPELQSSETAILIQDTIQIETYIKSVMPDAFRAVMKVAPDHLINTNALGQFTEATIGNGYALRYTSGGSVVLTIPYDFLRFSSLKLKSWKKPVTEVQTPDKQLWHEQYVPQTEAGYYKPVANWVDTAQYGRAIELHPVKKIQLSASLIDKDDPERGDKIDKLLNDSIEYFAYMPIPKINHDTESITPYMDESLLSAVAFMCASLVCGIFEMPKQAEYYEKKAFDIVAM